MLEATLAHGVSRQTILHRVKDGQAPRRPRPHRTQERPAYRAPSPPRTGCSDQTINKGAV